MGRANRFLRHASGNRHQLSRARQSRSALAKQDHLHRQSGAPAGDRSSGATPYAAPDAGAPMRVVVFGGSQGAHVMAEIVPAAIERMTPELRARLAVVQQARAEDLDAVRATYARLERYGRMRAVLSPTCRGAWRRRISSSRAPALPRWPNCRPSAGRPFWCRCRMRSTRTSSPMPACWRRPAARSGSSSAISRPSGWPPRSPGSPADPARLARMAARRQIGRHHRRRRAAGGFGDEGGGNLERVNRGWSSGCQCLLFLR